MDRLVLAMGSMLRMPQTWLLLAAIGITFIANDWEKPLMDILLYAIRRLSQ
jgi:hypothetical protein